MCPQVSWRCHLAHSHTAQRPALRPPPSQTRSTSDARREAVHTTCRPGSGLGGAAHADPSWGQAEEGGWSALGPAQGEGPGEAGRGSGRAPQGLTCWKAGGAPGSGRGPEAGGKRSAGTRAPWPPGPREAGRQAGREAALMLPEKPWRPSDTGTPPPGAEPGDLCQAPGASPGPAPRLGRGRQACRTASPRPGTARAPPPRLRAHPARRLPPPQSPHPPRRALGAGALEVDGCPPFRPRTPAHASRPRDQGGGGRGGPNTPHSPPSKPLTALGSPWQPRWNGGRWWGLLGTCTRWTHGQMGLGVWVAGLGSDAFLWPSC